MFAGIIRLPILLAMTAVVFNSSLQIPARKSIDSEIHVKISKLRVSYCKQKVEKISGNRFRKGTETDLVFFFDLKITNSGREAIKIQDPRFNGSAYLSKTIEESSAGVYELEQNSDRFPDPINNHRAPSKKKTTGFATTIRPGGTIPIPKFGTIVIPLDSAAQLLKPGIDFLRIPLTLTVIYFEGESRQKRAISTLSAPSPFSFSPHPNSIKINSACAPQSLSCINGHK